MAKKIARCMTNCDLDHFDGSNRQPPTRSLLDERSPLKQNFEPIQSFGISSRLQCCHSTLQPSADSAASLQQGSSLYCQPIVGEGPRSRGPRRSRPTPAIRSSPELAVKVFQEFFRGLSRRAVMIE